VGGGWRWFASCDCKSKANNRSTNNKDKRVEEENMEKKENIKKRRKKPMKSWNGKVTKCRSWECILEKTMKT